MRKAGRVLSGTALLVILAVSGMIGADKVDAQMVSIPVTVKTVDRDVLSMQSLEETREALRLQRNQEMAMLEDVIEQGMPDSPVVHQALEQKMQIVKRMQQEAEVEAALAYMGYDHTAVLSGMQVLTVFSPYAYLSDESNRIKMMDCVCTQTGFQPENVKIILSKNE